ncbi:hypothetical protein DACRYDRAFT_25286 [Dacryopinax primogenitus]|uniref:Uncharacterized protein n=1 Tax=Dacryopinax primogenitus (strain DJM 731) TaxID=1858805 RepID=M5FPM7_DACPD|nr:uncharacterized protein DACRYDRAFT_25286 [Dacryopinax primogenitus]EJT97173.1 hypothetical protein DACRYDRAFT_25286 [Dacryopinax primogenitus]
MENLSCLVSASCVHPAEPEIREKTMPGQIGVVGHQLYHDIIRHRHGESSDLDQSSPKDSAYQSRTDGNNVGRFHNNDRAHLTLSTQPPTPLGSLLAGFEAV